MTGVQTCALPIFLTVFVPSCTVWRIFHAVWASSILKILLNSSIETALKIAFMALPLKVATFFFRSLPLAYRSSQLLSSIFYKIPNSLINRFQECFYPYFPIDIVVPIKVRRDHKRVTVFHDNRGQGSTLRSKDLNTRANPLWYHLYIFRPLNTNCLT